MMDQVGVPISIIEAEAFFEKHGHKNGSMSHSKFINVITKQPKKQMADELQGPKHTNCTVSSCNGACIATNAYFFISTSHGILIIHLLLIEPGFSLRMKSTRS